MLSKIAKNLSRNGNTVAKSRNFAALTVNKEAAKVVKFQKEDMAKVVAEVPEFKFYNFSDGLVDYPYRTVAMDHNLAPIGTGTPAKPKWETSELENKLRIVSRDRGGDMATLALYVKAGSRFETQSELGLAHCVQAMGWRSTAHLSYLRTIKTLEQLGGHAEIKLSREHIKYEVSVPREYVPIVIPLLTGNVLFPRMLRWEVDGMKQDLPILRKGFEQNVDQKVSELFHETAFLNNTIGNKLWCRDRVLGEPTRVGGQVKGVTSDDMRNYMMKWFSSDRMALVGVNCDHETLTKWTMRSFVDHNAIPPNKQDEPKPQYTGGMHQQEYGKTNFLHLAIGFECGNFVSSATAAGVLNAYLSSGAASRCSQELNTNQSLISLNSFSNLYSDSGVFGLYAQVDGEHTESAIKSMAAIFKDKPNAEAVKRAKAQVKAELIQAMGDTKNVARDAGEQIMMTGGVTDLNDLLAQVDKVTDAEVQQILQNGLKTPPTVVAYGNTSYMKNYDAVKEMLK